jgi:hypothetical protein
MKAYGGVDVKIHIFLNSALDGSEWSASRPGRFTPRERVPGTHWIGDLVSPRAGLADVEKREFFTLPGLEVQPFRRPWRSQSLYRLRCPDSHVSSLCVYTVYCTNTVQLTLINNIYYILLLRCAPLKTIALNSIILQSIRTQLLDIA